MVSIPKPQWSILAQEVKKAMLGNETGGIILGRPSANGFGVTVLGPPGPNAIHRPDFFLRDLAFAQGLSQEAWDLDGSEWIGEWHTHPRSGLSPSAADLKTYRRHLDDPELRFNVFVSVIAKQSDGELLVAAWAVSANDVTRLQIDK